MQDELQQRLDGLMARVVDMGERADAMLGAALQALEAGDLDAAQRVEVADEQVDRSYEQVQHGVLTLIALHGPSAGDLRLATSLLHVSLHLERMADYASGVARVVGRVAEFPGDAELAAQLLAMGGHAREVGRCGLDAFVRRDVDAARDCATTDDIVDRENTEIFRRLVRLAASDEQRLEWATHMTQVARHLERFADHGVDVAEQAVFAVTGKAVELSSRAET